MEDDIPILGDSTKKRAGRRGLGRPKGSPNRITRTLKESVLTAFDEIGGVEWLKGLAESDPRAFSTLLSRLLPQETRVDATMEGEVCTHSGGIIAIPAPFKSVQEWRAAFDLDEPKEIGGESHGE